MTKLLPALLLFLATTLTVGGQTRYVPDATGTWKPWRYEANSDARRRFAARPADVKAVEASLLALNAILQRTAGFAPPTGFSVETVGMLDEGWAFSGPPALTARPLPSTLNFGAYGISEFERNGKTIRDDGGETTQLFFLVNVPPIPYARQVVPEFQEIDTDVSLLAPPERDLFGMPRYHDVLVLRHSTVPLWTAVPLEEAVALVGRSLSQRLDVSQGTMARLQQQLADARDPAKRAAREAEITTVAGIAKNPGLVDIMQKADRVGEATLAAAAAPTGDIGREITALQAELATVSARLTALPPADRTAPACYASGGATLLGRVRGGPDASCVAIVRSNPQLFNPALPRTAPQILTIARFASCLYPQAPTTNAGNCPANLKLLQGLDTAAVLAWLQ